MFVTDSTSRVSACGEPPAAEFPTHTAVPLYRDPDLPVGSCPRIVSSLKRWLPDFIEHLPTAELRSKWPCSPNDHHRVCMCICIWFVDVCASMCLCVCIWFVYVWCIMYNMHVPVQCQCCMSYLLMYPLGDFVVQFIRECKLQNPGDISLCFFSEALSLVSAQPLLGPEGIQALR